MRARRKGSWIPHGVLLAILISEGAAWGLAHRSAAELEPSAAAADERIEALHVLTNRGEPDRDRFAETFVQALLAEEDPLLCEYAFTSDVCNLSATLQYQYLKERLEAVDAHWWRSFVIYRRKLGAGVGGSSARITPRELGWYLDALAERPLPADELRRYQQDNP